MALFATNPNLIMGLRYLEEMITYAPVLESIIPSIVALRGTSFTAWAGLIGKKINLKIHNHSWVAWYARKWRVGRHESL